MSIPDIDIPNISIPHIPVQVIEPVRVFGDYVVHPSFSEPSLLLPGSVSYTHLTLPTPPYE